MEPKTEKKAEGKVEPEPKSLGEQVSVKGEAKPKPDKKPAEAEGEFQKKIDGLTAGIEAERTKRQELEGRIEQMQAAETAGEAEGEIEDALAGLDAKDSTEQLAVALGIIKELKGRVEQLEVGDRDRAMLLQLEGLDKRRAEVSKGWKEPLEAATNAERAETLQHLRTHGFPSLAAAWEDLKRDMIAERHMEAGETRGLEQTGINREAASEGGSGKAAPGPTLSPEKRAELDAMIAASKRQQSLPRDYGA